MTSSDRWAELTRAASSPQGVTRLRVAPESPHDLFVGVIQPGAKPCFWFEMPTDDIPGDYSLPSLRSVATTIRAIPEAPETTRIELALENADLAEVFRAMVNDLVQSVAATNDAEDGLVALAQRMERWRRLLQTDGGGGLSVAERRGLFGELTILAQLIDAGAEPRRAVATWTGPAGRHQDFQAEDGAIEVKSTATKQPQSLVIASERELDSTGVPHLYLMHLSLDERQGGSGDSLNALVAAIRQRLAGDAVAEAALDGLLIQVGYLAMHMPLYESLRYTVRAQTCYEVADGFPCMTENDIPIGVGDVTYRIQLAALQPFGLSAADALSTVAGLP